MTRMTVGAKQMMNLLGESEEGMGFISKLITPNLSIPVSRTAILFLVCATSYTFHSELLQRKRKRKGSNFSEQDPKAQAKATRKR